MATDSQNDYLNLKQNIKTFPSLFPVFVLKVLVTLHDFSFTKSAALPCRRSDLASPPLQVPTFCFFSISLYKLLIISPGRGFLKSVSLIVALYYFSFVAHLKRPVWLKNEELLQPLPLSHSFVLTATADSDLNTLLSVCAPLPCGAGEGGW